MNAAYWISLLASCLALLGSAAVVFLVARKQARQARDLLSRAQQVAKKQEEEHLRRLRELSAVATEKARVTS